MIILARSNLIVKDSRVLKYVKYMQDNDVDYYLLGWNRRSEPVDLNRACFFKRKSGYNVGGFKAAWHRCLWIIFCLKCFMHYKPDVIHGCDLDSAFPAVLYKLLFRRKVKIIFDIFDWFSATLWNQGAVLTNIFRKMEYRLCPRLLLKVSNTSYNQTTICKYNEIIQKLLCFFCIFTLFFLMHCITK